MARPRIVEHLDDRWNRAVISIVAGAGFGKSTLLAQAMASNAIAPRGRDVWLSLEPRDNDASTLLAALASVLNPGHTTVGAAATVEQLTQLLWTYAPLDIAVLLDDTHVLDAGSTGTAAVAELVDTLPTNTHLVLAGRRPPNLKLARLLAHDRAIELTENDLRFTSTEEATLATNLGAPGQATDPDLGGWAALLTLHHRFGLKKATDFATEEVVSQLDESDRQRLLIASLLDGASQDQLAEIAAEAKLEQTASGIQIPTDLSNLPLVSTEVDGTVRPHHLWLEILAATTAKAELDHIRRAGAAVLLRSGQPGRAWELLAAAGDHEPGLPALYDAINDQNAPPRSDQLDRWLAAMPDDLSDRAEVRYLEAIRLRETRPWSPRLDDTMQASLDAFEASGDVARYLGSAIRATFSVWLTCNQSRLTQLGDVARRYADAVPGLREIGVLNEAAQADVAGDGERALELLAGLSLDDFEPRLAFFLPMYRTSAYLNAARPEEAHATAIEVGRAAALCDGAGGTLLSRAAEPLCRFFAGDLDVDIDTHPFTDFDAYNVGEQLELMAWRGIVAAHQGRVELAGEILTDLGAPHRPGFDLPRFASARAVLAATLSLATHGQRGSTEALEDLLATRGRVGAEWRAIAWHPGIAFLVDPDRAAHLTEVTAAFLDHPSVLLARAITRSRSGARYVSTNTPIDNPASVFAALPLACALELACAGFHAKDDRSNELVEFAAYRWPGPTREALRLIADSGSGLAQTAARLLSRVPIPPANPVRVGVLGQLTLHHGDRPEDSADWRRDRVRQLLLLLVRHRRISREHLASALWPQLEADAAARNLRLTLHYLNSVLEPERSGGEAAFFIRQRDSFLELTPSDHLIVDAWHFDDLDRMAQRALEQGNAAQATSLLSKMTDLWRGDYLVDLDRTPDADVETEREAFKRRFASSAVRLSGLLGASGRADESAEMARRGIEADPWSERAYCSLAAALDSAGDAVGAIRALDRCRSMLAELTLEPSPETEMLERRIRSTGRASDCQPE